MMIIFISGLDWAGIETYTPCQGWAPRTTFSTPKEVSYGSCVINHLPFGPASMSHFQMCQHIPHHLCVLPKQHTARVITTGTVLTTLASCSCCSLLEIAHSWRHQLWLRPCRAVAATAGCQPQLYPGVSVMSQLPVPGRHECYYPKNHGCPIEILTSVKIEITSNSSACHTVYFQRLAQSWQMWLGIPPFSSCPLGRGFAQVSFLSHSSCCFP